MKRPVLWSRDALDELKAIGRFIAKDNREAARKMAIAIRLAGDKLSDAPTGRKGRVSGTYEKTIPNLRYILVYAFKPPLEGQQTIVILRVIHSARDWPPETWPGA